MLTLLLMLQGQSQAAASAVAAAVNLPNANAGVIIQALAQTVRGVDDTSAASGFTALSLL